GSPLGLVRDHRTEPIAVSSPTRPPPPDRGVVPTGVTGRRIRELFRAVSRRIDRFGERIRELCSITARSHGSLRGAGLPGACALRRTPTVGRLTLRACAGAHTTEVDAVGSARQPFERAVVEDLDATAEQPDGAALLARTEDSIRGRPGGAGELR